MILFFLFFFMLDFKLISIFFVLVFKYNAKHVSFNNFLLLFICSYESHKYLISGKN